jgi:hypothetical protein
LDISRVWSLATQYLTSKACSYKLRASVGLGETIKMTMNKVNRFTFGTFLSVPLRPAAAACLLVLLFGAGAGETQSERRSSLRRFSAVQQLTRPPSLSLKAQTPGDTVYVPQLNLKGLLSHPLSHFASVSCNGKEMSGSGLSFDCQVDLVEGTNQIAAIALDQAGNQADAALTITYIPLPSVTITAPADGAIVNTPSIALSGSVDDDGAAVDINGAPATSGSFDTAVALHQGQNLIVVSATNSAGGVGTAHLTVTLDTTPPRVAFDSPAEGFVSRQPTLAVSGMVNDLVVGTVNAAQVRVEVNGVQAQVSNRCFLVENLPLQVGANTLEAVATDIAGNTASSTIEVFFDAGIGQAQIRNIEGSNQTGVAGSLLPGPLVTELVGADGNPLIDQPVLFRVMQNNGRLVGSQALGAVLLRFALTPRGGHRPSGFWAAELVPATSGSKRCLLVLPAAPVFLLRALRCRRLKLTWTQVATKLAVPVGLWRIL